MKEADHPDLESSVALADAVEAIRSADVDPDAERHREAILDFVAAHDDSLHRSCRQGHLTGSALVVDTAGEHVLLLFHTKLQRWLQPGGHCDGDANLAAVALREATEETGIDGLRIHPVAIDLDVHEVDPPADGPHLHLDARFLVVAPPGAVPEGNHESQGIRWVAPGDLDGYDIDEGTVRMVRHGLALHASISA
ncbi:NUDIX hydrolase [Actinospongicola halichondriae]|uniref:NUDIX hydrolase n=1 Tax=Actinospongicola halichondriae TaxID=3236844 RepID=UPI003D478E67